MKTVVTGGTGFIGSHLVKALFDQGRETVVATDFAGLGLENLANLRISPSDIEIRQVDLVDYEQCLKAMEGVDVIFHLAARVGSLEYARGSHLAELESLQTNIPIDTNVFKTCLEKEIKEIFNSWERSRL